MEETDYWQMFKDTGDPMCWLLLRKSEREKKNGSEQDARADG